LPYLEIISFNTAEALKKYLDDEIGRIRTLIGDLLRRLEEIRLRAERFKKAQAALVKFAGEKQMPALEGKEMEMPGFRVIINPGPKQETETLEGVVTSLQSKLDNIVKIRKSIDPLADFEEGVTISTVISEGIPSKMMIYLKP